MLLQRKVILATTAAIILPRLWALVGLMPLPCILQVGEVDPAHAPKLHLISLPENDLLLKHARKLAVGHVHGVESVAVDDADGSLILMDRYGNLMSVDRSAAAAALSSAHASPGGDAHAALPLHQEAYVGPGRPLGYQAHNGSILICDSLKGLTQFDKRTKLLTVLTNRVSTDTAIDPGTTINYADDLDVADDGSAVYFSDASAIPTALGRGGFYDTMSSYLLTMLQGEPTGRVLVYHPQTRSTEVVVPRLWFPNGVALSADNSYIVVAETPSMRLLKHYLKGEKAGKTEVLLDGLPGYPDGLARASDGGFWVALLAPLSPIQRVLELGGRPVRWALAWLLQVFPLPLRGWGVVLKVSPAGEIVAVLMDKYGSNIAGISGLHESHGKLWMGHLSYDYISVVNLKDVGLAS